MNVSQITLRDIEYLVAVSEELHFGRAALRLNVSQPTLSEQIKKLEERLSLKFFERSKRGVRLTPEGQKIIEVGRKVLKEAANFISIATEKAAPLTGRFVLGAIGTVAPYYLPYIIGPLRRAYPQLELIIEEGYTDELLQKLSNGDLDALVASRTFNESSFRVYCLYNEPFWLAAPSDKKISLTGEEISIKNIDRSELILLKEGNCLKDEVLDFCNFPKGSHYKLQAASIETLKYLVASGNGITFIPELAKKDEKKLKGLINYYSFKEKSAFREIVLVTRNEYARPDDIRLLYKIMQKNLPEF